MVRFGPKLEKRQAVLGRLVEIGAELLAITAACARARATAEGDRASAEKLADVFSRHARRRVEERFERIFDNDDVATYRLAQEVLQGQHSWLEQGMVRTTEER
jgi:hypothetical protein